MGDRGARDRRTARKRALIVPKLDARMCHRYYGNGIDRILRYVNMTAAAMFN